jgi:hypothetical protein
MGKVTEEKLMTNTLELKRSNLVLPNSFQELDREEMCYVEGGGMSTGVLAAIIDVGLLVVVGVINAALNGVKVCGKTILKAYIKNNASKWAASLFKVQLVVNCIQGVGGNLATITGMFGDAGPWVDRVLTMCSIGGLIATAFDLASDGRWDGQIQF